MPSAWIENYWIRYPISSESEPRITFQGWTTGGNMFTAFLYITEDMRFDIIKAQLDCESVFVSWDSSLRVSRVFGLQSLV
jgi:hypothetical protein